MIKALVKISNALDKHGLTKEADYLDSVIKKYAEQAPVTVHGHAGRMPLVEL